MKKILIFIILTFILTSCEILGTSDLSDSQNQQNMLYPPAVEYSDSDGYPVMTPIGNDIIDIKNPDKGLSAITGKLLLLDNRPMNNATIYLTLGKGDTNEDPPANSRWTRIVKRRLCQSYGSIRKFLFEQYPTRYVLSYCFFN